MAIYWVPFLKIPSAVSLKFKDRFGLVKFEKKYVLQRRYHFMESFTFYKLRSKFNYCHGFFFGNGHDAK